MESKDFCIWVLERDGLQVAPFDRHGAGDSMLQRAGLTADSWRSWLHNVVTFYQQCMQALHLISWQIAMRWRQSQVEQGRSHWHAQGESFSQERLASLAQEYSAATTPSQHDQHLVMRRLVDNMPPALWHGNADVGQQLHDLWQQYRSRGVNWTGRLITQLMDDGTEQRLQNDLLPYHTRLEMLNLCFASYPHAVTYLIPLVSVIMTLANGHLDGAIFHARVLHAAEGLAMGTKA